MRKIFLSILTLNMLWLTACGEEKKDAPGIDTGQTVDKTTGCKSPVETGAYTTFYKPAIGWFGDPIPFSDNGKFYIFDLQDWRSNFPYLHPWHMVSSDDLSSFRFEGEIIPCGNVDDQDVALGTGGVIKSREDGKYYAFYTGHKWNPQPGKPIQAVLLTTSSDLKNWTKDKSFFLSISGDGYDMNEFRDPHVYFDEESGLYKMIVSAKRNNQATLALLTSADLRNWELQEPLYTDASTGMMECADLFKMGNYWYLTYSNVRDRKVHYLYSKSQNGPWIAPAHSAFDGIAFYAGKTMSDGTDRYLVGWCPTRIGDGAEDQWGGSMICHRLVSNPNGSLYATIPEGIDNKFNRSISLEDIDRSGSVRQSGDLYILSGKAAVTFPRLKNPGKITTTVTASSPDDIFGLTFGACDGGEDVYSIRFDPAAGKLSMYKGNGTDRVKQTEVELPVPANRAFRIKIVTEKSVAVVYVNEQIAFTNRIDRLNQNPWQINSEQGNGISFSNIEFFEN